MGTSAVGRSVKLLCLPNQDRYRTFEYKRIGELEAVSARGGKTQADVAIVGGGPVGLGLSIDLAQRGISSIVIERSNTLHNIPKGQNLTQRTGEHFRSWGVVDQIRQASPIPRSFGNAGLVAYDRLLGDYHYDWFKRGSVNEFYFAENERLPQYRTEEVLRQRASEFDNITIHYDCQGQSVDQNGQGASAEILNRETGETFSVSANYLVGCDGSRSQVRQSAGIGQEIDPHDKRMVLLVFKSRELHRLLERYPGKSIYNTLKPELDGYWQFLGRVDLDGTWFFHAPVPVDTRRDNFDFHTYLHSAMGAEFDLEFDHIGFWDLRIAVAETYQAGRIFIAGDSAHSHPPYGGYGVNTGFEDARNLGWKLEAAIRGWGGDDLLASYGLERKAVFQSTSRDFINRMIVDDREFGKTFAPAKDKPAFEQAWAERASQGNADVTQFLPHYEGSPINDPVAGATDHGGARGIHMMAARAGHHLAPAELTNGQDLFDSLGRGFALIVLDGSQDVIGGFEQAALEIDLPLATICEDSEALQQHYRAKYVLVRPDHFVSWAGNDPAGQETAILMRAIGGRAVRGLES